AWSSTTAFRSETSARFAPTPGSKSLNTSAPVLGSKLSDIGRRVIQVNEKFLRPRGARRRCSAPGTRRGRHSVEERMRRRSPRVPGSAPSVVVRHHARLDLPELTGRELLAIPEFLLALAVHDRRAALLDRDVVGA